MKQYLKMADVFRDVVQPERFNYAMANQKATYTAHAINSHDELVQMNQWLLEALELASASLSDAATKMKWSDIPTAQAILRNADAIDAAIAKAKGGAA